MRGTTLRSPAIGFLTFLFIWLATSETVLPQAPANALTPDEIRQGWMLLFDGTTTSGWRRNYQPDFPAEGWAVENGALVVLGQQGGDIITIAEFSSFDFKFEFKLTEGANSGVKYFVVEKYDGSSIGLEYQILDDDRHPDAKQGVGGNRQCAALYDLLPATGKVTRPVGEWNQGRIVVVGNHAEHWLNGKKVLEYERCSPAFQTIVQKSKFTGVKDFGCWPQGHILLQDHGNEVYYRNLKIRILSERAGGPTKLTPDNPKWGDTVTVTYDPAVRDAKFQPEDTVYIYYQLKFPGLSKNSWAKMDVKDGKFKWDIRIPEGASSIYISFITMDGCDSNADLRSMIFRQDGVPAEGAWQWKLSLDSSETGYLDAFKNERKLYPDNYLVYRNKWWADANFNKDSLKAIISREIAALKKPGINESPGLLWALSCGYLLLDDEKASREVLRRMVLTYPDSEDTAEALREYDYHAFSKQFQGEGPEEVKQLKLELLKKAPTAKSLRDYILLWIAYEKDPPLDIVRAGFEAWIKDEPDNPKPYYTLAMVLLEKNQGLNEAAGLIVKALDKLVAGKLRLFGDSTGRMTERSLPDYYSTAAAIHEKLGGFSIALAEIKAAQSLAKEENRPELYMAEASIWRSLGYFNKAEKSLLEAGRRGAKNADGELRAVYRQRRKTDEGFDAWLAGKRQEQSTAASGDKKPAPGFEVKSLDGETVRLADLKGKVAVLNFWYIGCAPCQVEIPGLNKLVEEFKTGQVAFIGFALDDESRLREFLKKTPFNYRIIAGSSSITKQYGVSAYPTHVIINKQGVVEFTITGGSPDIQEKLRPLLQGLLK